MISVSAHDHFSCPKRSPRRRIFLVRIVAAAILFWLHGAACAENPERENPLKKLTLEQLGNVQVTTAARTPESARKTPAAIFVITGEDIKRAAVTTIPEALRLAPGVEVSRIDGNKWSVGIRGFGSRLARNVLVLIDGRTVYTTLLAGTYWEVQNVMMEDVDRIEVIRGPGATIWGPNAVNGVINIITKPANATHGKIVSARGGSLKLGSAEVRYGAGNGRGLDYRVYALAFDRGPEFHTDGNNYDSWRALQGGFRLDFSEHDRDAFTMQGDIYKEGAGETVNATSYTAPYSQIVRGTELLSGGNVLLRWKHTQAENKSFEVQAYYDRTSRQEPNFADFRNTFDLDFLQRLPIPGRQQISWGAGARFSDGRNPTIVSGLYFIPQSRTDELLTGFIQDEVAVVPDRLNISFGTKLLKTNYTGVMLQPSARLLWTPSERQSFWAAFTHAVRTPSAAERAFYLSGFIGTDPTSGLPFFARFNANPNFRSEQLNGYEMGFRQLVRKSIYFDLALFFNHYSDLFSEDITGAPFVETNPAPTHILLPAEFGNGLLGTTRGVEFAPEWRPKSFLRLRASYSFLQMEIEKSRNSLDVGTAPFVEGSSPRHQVAAQSSFDFTKKLSLDLTYRFVSHLAAEHINSYSTADARFSWQATNSLNLSVAGRNLFQPYHYEAASDPGPNVGIKRTVYGQITWQK